MDTKRHPSQITIEEFIEIAKIINPVTFKRARNWRMIDTATQGVNNSYRLVSHTTKCHFHIDWDGPELSFDYYDGLHEELQFPYFCRSLKIAQYLEEIGIEYRSMDKDCAYCSGTGYDPYQNHSTTPAVCPECSK